MMLSLELLPTALIFQLKNLQAEIINLKVKLQLENFCFQMRSYTCTTSAHRFHHHSMDTLLGYPCVHVLWPTVHQSAFPEVAF